MDALLVPEMPLLLLDTTLGLQLHFAIGNPVQLLLMYFLLPITIISSCFRYDRMLTLSDQGRLRLSSSDLCIRLSHQEACFSKRYSNSLSIACDYQDFPLILKVDCWPALPLARLQLLQPFYLIEFKINYLRKS